MKFITFKDIANQDVCVNPEKVDFVRQHVSASEDNKDVEITVLIQMGSVSIPVEETYENTLKKLGIELS